MEGKTISQSPEQELEGRVQLLLNGFQNQDPSVIKRVRVQLPNLTEIELPGLNEDHAKITVAKECGFQTWQMALDVLNARLNPGDDFGDFWYALKTDVLLSYWCHNYQESLEIQIENGGYLLPYRKQFVVVQKTYIEILRMDPADPAWESVQYNLVKPGDLAAYKHLVLSRLKQIQND